MANSLLFDQQLSQLELNGFEAVEPLFLSRVCKFNMALVAYDLPEPLSVR